MIRVQNMMNEVLVANIAFDEMISVTRHDIVHIGAVVETVDVVDDVGRILKDIVDVV
jgi:hypothetical protein